MYDTLKAVQECKDSKMLARLLYPNFYLLQKNQDEWPCFFPHLGSAVQICIF